MTAPHISEEIPRMLTGEADRDTVLDAAAHLRTCVDCQHELVSALVAHASLSSAQRFAPDIVNAATPGNFTDAAESAAPSPAPAAEDSTPRPLPDLDTMFAQVRAEAEAGAATPARHRSAVTSIDAARPHRTRYLVGTAAAALVVGAAGVVYGVTAGDDNGSAPSVSRSVALAAYGTGTSSGRATIGSGAMKIDAASLPRVAGKRYEVWLTNSKRTAMQPIGWIGTDGTASLTVPKDLMTKFSDIEVSVQDLSANSYDYSGVSVLRGSLD